MTEPTRTLIPIERLTAGHEVYIPGFGAAEVYAVEWDRDAYRVSYCTDDELGWDALDHIRVDAGETLEHALLSEPRYWRSRSEITAEELAALRAALNSDEQPALQAAE